MSWRTYYWNDLADDERAAIANGHGCGLCLDFGYLSGLGPCPRCRADGHAEHLLATARSRSAPPGPKNTTNGRGLA